MKHYVAIYMPDNIGCNETKLDKKAPKTYEFLYNKIQELIKKYEKLI